MNSAVAILLVVFLPAAAAAAADHGTHSPYAGQESRAIKSLSADDIEDLENGRGWGLAKIAELNGMPGPVHLLEMKEQIGLSGDQVDQIETLYQEMKGQAIPLGRALIEIERRLDVHFAAQTISDELLRDLLARSAEIRGQLRYVHLAAHLLTPDLLTAGQIERYNELRGYTSADPCANVPAGHDPAMWKRHHNCP